MAGISQSDGDSYTQDKTTCWGCPPLFSLSLLYDHLHGTHRLIGVEDGVGLWVPQRLTTTTHRTAALGIIAMEGTHRNFLSAPSQNKNKVFPSVD